MSSAKNLLALLLIANVCFSIWVQPLNISVADMNGKPVEKAQVTVIYQKASQVSENDGVLNGETNADGFFTGEITNRVQSSLASRNIQIKVYTNYWPGETRKIVANESEKKQLRFIVPFKLEDVYIKAVTNKQFPVKGASVVIAGKVPIKKQTAADGRVRFFFPQNFSFSGFVSILNVSKKFSSQEIKTIEGKKTIAVELPPLEGEILGSVAGEGRNSLAIAFIGLNDTPLADSRVLLSFNNKSYSLYSDSDGVAGFLTDKTGVLNASIREYDFDYNFSLNITAGNNTTEVALYHLLKVASFKSQPQAEQNCFKMVANVSDPRSSLPIRVRMYSYQSSKNATLLKVNSTSNATSSGLYYSELCIKSDTPIRVTAQNKYDVAEASVNLTFVRPKGPGPVKPANQTLLGGPEIIKPKDSDDMVVVAIVLLIACLLGAFFARAYLSRSSRFMIEYLRKTRENVEKRRHKPGVPPVMPIQPKPPEQQPPLPPQQPPQSQ